MYNRVIKQAVVEESDDVFQIPGAEEPKPARARAPGRETEGEAAHGEQPPEPTEEELALAARLAKAEAAVKAAERRVQELEQTSERILRNANEQSAQILASAKEQAAALCEQAREQGYTEALEQHAEAMKAALDGVSALMEELSTRQQRYFKEYGEQLEDLAITVAEKLLAHTIEADPGQMADLVMQAVTSLKTEDWITVELSDQMAGLIEQIQTQYAAYLSRRPVEFAAKEAPPGSCVVQTATGITDASIATQLGNLRRMIHQ